jgi:hypothetical protein
LVVISTPNFVERRHAIENYVKAQPRLSAMFRRFKNYAKTALRKSPLTITFPNERVVIFSDGYWCGVIVNVTVIAEESGYNRTFDGI